MQLSVRLLALLALLPSVAWATVPSVVASEGTIDATGSASHTINVPGNSCSAGQLLVATVSSSEVTDDIGFPVGWVGIVARQTNSEAIEVAYLECAGTEGATFDVTFSTGDAESTMLAVVLRISGHDTAADPEATAAGGSATNTPNPPALTPTGGSKDYLWITAALQDDMSALTSCPTNYTTNCASQDTGSTGVEDQTLAWSWRGNTATSENPDVFTFVDSDTWDAVTIAVHPAAAGPAFTDGPTVGTLTLTTIPLTFTTDTTGNVESVACPDGQTFPTVAQVLAGNCTGDVAAEATFVEAVTATVSDGATLTGLTAGTTYDVHSAIDAATDSTAIATNADVATNSLPAFTDGPAAGSITSTTVPVTFTVDQDGDVYGVACPDGQAAPSVAQVKAGDCTGDVAAVDAFTQAVVATVADGDTFTGLTASTTYDTHYMIDSTVNGDTAAITTLANQATQSAAVVAFSVGPSVAAAADGYTISGTVDQDATVYAVAYNPGATVPSCTQIQAGQNQAGAAALMDESEAWTEDVGNSFALTVANTTVRKDIAVCASNGNGDGTVTELANQNRSARAGFALACPSSVSATSIFDLDGYFDPDFAAADCIEYEDDTNESANCNVLFDVDGDHGWYDATDGVNTQNVVGTLDETGDAGNDSIADCAGRLTFEISYQDVSIATTGLFTAPTVGNFTTDDTIFNGNSAPEFNEAADTEFLFEVDIAISPVVLADRWTDADADTITVTYQDALPSGLTNNAGSLEGTPDTCGATTATERGTDIASDFGEQDIEFTIGARVPDVADDDEATAIAAIEAAGAGAGCTLTAAAGTPRFSATVTLGDVIETVPVIGELVPHDQEVTYVLSLGPRLLKGGRTRIGLGLGIP